MLLSAVSVLVVAQSSSEIPEGLMNDPVFEWIVVTSSWGSSSLLKMKALWSFKMLGTIMQWHRSHYKWLESPYLNHKYDGRAFFCRVSTKKIHSCHNKATVQSDRNCVGTLNPTPAVSWQKSCNTLQWHKSMVNIHTHTHTHTHAQSMDYLLTAT